MLGDHHVARLRGEFGEDRSIPCIADQDPALAAVRRDDVTPDAHAPMLDPVGRMIATSVGEIGIMFLPRIYNRQARVARRFEHARNRLNDALDGHDVDAGTVEHTAAAAEIMLHVDNHDGSASGIEADGFGPRGNRV